MWHGRLLPDRLEEQKEGKYTIFLEIKSTRTADLVEGVFSTLRGRPGAIVSHLCAQAGGGGETGLDAPKVLSRMANHGFFNTFFT